jgi:hypothetical protein
MSAGRSDGMPPREAVEVIEALVRKLKHGRADPVDIMNLYRALQMLPPADASRVIEETTGGSYMVVPTQAPLEWNDSMRRAYGIFMGKVKQEMLKPPSTHDHLDTAPDA